MNRQELSAISDTLWSLVRPNEATLSLMIEEASESESFETLLRDWLALHDLGAAEILKVKVWSGLPYSRLEAVFQMPSRDLQQLIRNQRMSLLAHYADAHRSDSKGVGGPLSCFMVDQYLSPWIDQEIQDLRLMRELSAHLLDCEPCRGRLEAYRQLERSLLSERRRAPEMSEALFAETLAHLKKKDRDQWIKWLSFLAFIISVGGLLIAFSMSRPADMPNVYSIPDQP